MRSRGTTLTVPQRMLNEAPPERTGPTLTAGQRLFAKPTLDHCLDHDLDPSLDLGRSHRSTPVMPFR